jgi:CRP-like cAMP-binding protein
LLAPYERGSHIYEPLASLRREAGTRQASFLASLEASGVPIIERCYSPGEHPYMRGDPDEGLWFLLEGTLKVYKLYGAFREATVRLLDGAGHFGEPSLRPTGSHRYSAVAISACRVAKVPKSPLQRHLTEDSSCAPALLDAFAECAEQREAVVERLLNREVDGRVACLLLELAERFGKKDEQGRALRVRLSHKDLSCMVACTREAVSQAISWRPWVTDTTSRSGASSRCSGRTRRS